MDSVSPYPWVPFKGLNDTGHLAEVTAQSNGKKMCFWAPSHQWRLCCNLLKQSTINKHDFFQTEIKMRFVHFLQKISIDIARWITVMYLMLPRSIHSFCMFLLGLMCLLFAENSGWLISLGNSAIKKGGNVTEEWSKPWLFLLLRSCSTSSNHRISLTDPNVYMCGKSAQKSEHWKNNPVV